MLCPPLELPRSSPDTNIILLKTHRRIQGRGEAAILPPPWWREKKKKKGKTKGIKNKKKKNKNGRRGEKTERKKKRKVNST